MAMPMVAPRLVTGETLLEIHAMMREGEVKMAEAGRKVKPYSTFGDFMCCSSAVAMMPATRQMMRGYCIPEFDVQYTLF